MSPDLRREGEALRSAVANARTLIATVIDQYRPKHIVALFSGGHDSLVATHLASETCPVAFACHIDTGFGISETQDFVAKACSQLALPLRCYSAGAYRRPNGDPDPQDYRKLVLERGFPGPAMHTKMYNRLKERPLRQMIRALERRRNDRVLLVSGLRASESSRRGRRPSPIQVWEGTKIWLAPLWEFSKLDINAYIEHHELPRNPVVDALHKSGECLCGAFARPGEKEEIRFWYPEVAHRIDQLEAEVKAKGFDWGWGEKPTKSTGRGPNLIEATLCASCSTIAADGAA